ncbi:hypothetical protein ThesiDRAFT1_0110 [Thermoanaerobacter siderophilus SR4]|uniref:Uncharacterized protein n=1 Tax=Thermoanaerobacter siderophilus SR4 TaxID=880478 RepID=I8R1C3_9THEO|nr:hypothetical protein ThesiDRAFT1_0110 [Thermoanaerobacter siderophilus SR4]
MEIKKELIICNQFVISDKRNNGIMMVEIFWKGKY